ncbi:hypothetical protein Tco_0984859 [Tanacetum coccineum]
MDDTTPSDEYLDLDQSVNTEASNASRIPATEDLTHHMNFGTPSENKVGEEINLMMMPPELNTVEKEDSKAGPLFKNAELKQHLANDDEKPAVSLESKSEGNTDEATSKCPGPIGKILNDGVYGDNGGGGVFFHHGNCDVKCAVPNIETETEKAPCDVDISCTREKLVFKRKGVRVLLPTTDVVIADKLSPDANSKGSGINSQALCGLSKALVVFLKLSGTAKNVTSLNACHDCFGRSGETGARNQAIGKVWPTKGMAGERRKRT